MSASAVGYSKADLYLRASTLILHRECNIAVFGPSVRIFVELEFRPTLPPPSRHPLRIESLTTLLRVDDARDRAVLFAQLDLAELIAPPDRPLLRDSAIADSEAPIKDCASVVTMGEVLARVKSGRDITRLLAISADSVLWTGEEPDLAVSAVGRFVARMPHRSHRCAYGAALTEAATTAWGDLPSNDDLEWALGTLDPSGPPVASTCGAAGCQDAWATCRRPSTRAAVG